MTYGPEAKLKGKPLSLTEGTVFGPGCDISGTTITTNSNGYQVRPGCTVDEKTTIDGVALWA